MPKFRIGDVVQLNSGGPNLVVTNHCSQQGVSVVWMNEKNEYQKASFPEACLTLVKK